MAHDHAHSHAHAHGDTGTIRMAFLLNLGFTLLEFLGGIWTNSVAITADAIWAYASLFYRWRQHRWRRLVARGFVYEN